MAQGRNRRNSNLFKRAVVLVWYKKFSRPSLVTKRDRATVIVVVSPYHPHAVEFVIPPTPAFSETSQTFRSPRFGNENLFPFRGCQAAPRAPLVPDVCRLRQMMIGSVFHRIGARTISKFPPGHILLTVPVLKPPIPTQLSWCTSSNGNSPDCDKARCVRTPDIEIGSPSYRNLPRDSHAPTLVVRPEIS